MDLHIVLLAPEIPQNTGNIGRVCVNLDAHLHLIEPLSFSLEESEVKRAGLDYWQHVHLSVHRNWDSFLRDETPSRLFFASTYGKTPYWDAPFREGAYLVFGNETAGLPRAFYERYEKDLYVIPMPGRNARSLNLANAVSIVTYEAVRQITARSRSAPGPSP